VTVVADQTSIAAEQVQPPEGQGQPIAEQSAVQPDEGQGQRDSTGPYDLSSVPEEHRLAVEAWAKENDRKVQAKFTEAAEYRKTWEPYEALGLNEIDPESVEAIVGFARTLADEDAAKELIADLAREYGVIDADEAPAIDPDDPMAEIRAELAELREFKSQFDQDKELDAEAVSLREEFEQVEQQHGRPFTPEEQERLAKLAQRFYAAGDENPITAAYEVINDIAGTAEAALVAASQDQPAAAEAGGSASTAVEPVEDFDESLRLWRERNQSRT